MSLRVWHGDGPLDKNHPAFGGSRVCLQIGLFIEEMLALVEVYNVDDDHYDRNDDTCDGGNDIRSGKGEPDAGNDQRNAEQIDDITQRGKPIGQVETRRAVFVVARQTEARENGGGSRDDQEQTHDDVYHLPARQEGIEHLRFGAVDHSG